MTAPAQVLCRACRGDAAEWRAVERAVQPWRGNPGESTSTVQTARGSDRQPLHAAQPVCIDASGWPARPRTRNGARRSSAVRACGQRCSSTKRAACIACHRQRGRRVDGALRQSAASGAPRAIGTALVGVDDGRGVDTPDEQSQCACVIATAINARRKYKTASLILGGFGSWSHCLVRVAVISSRAASERVKCRV